MTVKQVIIQWWVFTITFTFSLAVYSGSLTKGELMKVKVSAQGKEIFLELEDNATSRDLLAQLPLEIKLEDYASNEKIFYPPQKLSKDGSPKGYEPKKGDVTYYAPWGDVAIFYKDFSYSTGLIYLGSITSGFAHLKELDGVQVKIEKID